MIDRTLQLIKLLAEETDKWETVQTTNTYMMVVVSPDASSCSMNTMV